MLPYHFGMSSEHDYWHIQRALAAAHALADAAEAHGTLAGALCALVPYRLEDWLAEILPEGVEYPATDVLLQSLYDETVASLSGPSMEFQLLIPQDDSPLQERARALTAWCTGFLYGLGSNGAADPQRLPGDLGEIVRDLTEITCADVDVSEGAEANEAALEELVEFVRVGVQLVFDELEPARTRHEAASGQVLH